MEKAAKLLVPSCCAYLKGFTAFYHPRVFCAIAAISTAAANNDNRFRGASASYSSDYIRSKMDPESYAFGPYKIHKEEVFYTSDLSFALVNLRPVVPGHVLICPKREVKRFHDLTDEEIRDLWLMARKVGRLLEEYHKATSLTFTIQDGPRAGQTVPHVHIHILPRKSGDFERNDEIYDAIDEKEKELKRKLDLDQERKDRSLEERTQEADEYRRLLS